VVFELAAQMGIKVKEVNLRLADLLAADEVFITNSLIELFRSPCLTANRQERKGGPLTHKLMKAYKEMVKKELSHYKREDNHGIL